MSQDQQRLFEYLRHILEANNRIQRYIEDIDESSFIDNELIQDAVIRNLEIIGEASNNIQRHFPEYVEQHANVPFSFAYEMRNVLAHGYFKVDLEVVWKTIERDLPDLEAMIQSLLNSQD